MAGLDSDSLHATPHESVEGTGPVGSPVANGVRSSFAPQVNAGVGVAGQLPSPARLSAAEVLSAAKQQLRFEAAVMTGELPPEPEAVQTLSETVDPLHESILSQRSDFVVSTVRAAMAGTLRGHRPLKEWEPAKLDHSHVQIALLAQVGRKAPEIAELLRLSEGRVRQLQAHPFVKSIISAITLDMARQAPDLAKRLERTAGVMLDIIEEITIDQNTPRDLRSKNAFRWLDIAGYGGSMTHAVEHRVTMDKRAADMLSAALAEAPQGVQEADWQFISDGSIENKRRLLAGGGGDVQTADISAIVRSVADAVPSGNPALDSLSLPIEALAQPLARAVPIQLPPIPSARVLHTRSKEPPDPKSDKDTPVGSAPRFMRKAASRG